MPGSLYCHEHGSMQSKKNTEQRSNRFRMVIAIVVANLIRLLRVIPDNDPIMSMAMPFSRRSAAITSFLFPFITMASFDIVTNEVGPWTAVTAVTYGCIGLAFHFALRGRRGMGLIPYLGYGAVGVLAFDGITGVLMQPLMFGGTFYAALVGQIPFTAMHLLTSSIFILVVTPLLDREVLLNMRLDDTRIRNFLMGLLQARA